MNTESLNIRLARLPEATISVELFTHTTKGTPASPKRLYEIAVGHMEAGICIFVFRKKDGSMRKAIGTLAPALLPFTDTKPPIDRQGVQNYYDLESRQFKAFSKDSVLAVLMF